MHDHLVKNQCSLGAVANGRPAIVTLDALQPVEFFELASARYRHWLRVLGVSARFLERVNIAANGALYAAHLVPVALEDDVGCVRPTLRAVPIRLAAIRVVARSTEVALEDLVHQ